MILQAMILNILQYLQYLNTIMFEMCCLTSVMNQILNMGINLPYNEIKISLQNSEILEYSYARSTTTFTAVSSNLGSWV